MTSPANAKLDLTLTLSSAPREVPSGSKDQLIGAQVGSYKIQKLLGTGGMGSVYLGEHSGIGSRVAIKFLHEHLCSNAELVQRFYAEARAVNVIGHANIVCIFDMNVLLPNRYYMVMEYLDGHSLETQVGTSMPMARAIPILLQVCDALDQAHELGVVHRDLKPENLMLVKRGRHEDFVKILDFGIAKFLSTMGNQKTAAGLIIGTPDYMAPEQANGLIVDARTDQYSLGVIAYELATGRTPFAGLSITSTLVAQVQQEPLAPHSLNPALPSGISAAIMKALAKQPEARFGSCGEFGRALEAALKVSSHRDPAASSPGAQAPPPPIEVEVTTDQGATQKLQMQQVSRAGCFLCTATPPRLSSRVMLTVPGVGSLQGDVVQLVSADQAQAWNMLQGFGVQFTSVRPEQREALNMLMKGLPIPSPVSQAEVSSADDRVTENVLAEFRDRIRGDHYAVLGLPPDVNIPGVKSRGREIARRFAELRTRAMSGAQARELDATVQRVEQAVDVLGSSLRRVAFDGMRTNWRGVAICLSAGLRVSELNAVRTRFLALTPAAESRGRMLLNTADSCAAEGNITEALHNCELALGIDPLNLELHKRHALLRRMRAYR